MCEDTDRKQASPPDGGWGWLVVFASFMIHVIADGVIFSFGVFHYELVKYFHSSEAATSLIASILVGFTLCVGPISSAFVNKYGSRVVVVGGGIMGALGIIVSAFVNQIFTLQITIGIITGTGLGMIYLPATVSVTSYFDRKRSLATGISVCGSGVGTFIMAPITQWLVDEYGWRGAMAISGALVLNIVVFGLLLRPLRLNPQQTPATVSVESINTPNMTEVRRGSNRGRLESNKLLNSKLVIVDNKLGYDMTKDESLQVGLHNITVQSKDLCLHNLPEEKPLMQVGVPKKHLESRLCCRPSHIKRCKSTIVDMLDFTLFKNPIFILFSISNFCTALGFNVPYVYIVSQARKKGIPVRDGSCFISIIGIANTSGRIILGYLFDKKFVNRQWIYNMCLIIGGVSTVLSTLCVSMLGFAVYSAIFGFTVGAYAGLTSVIVVDLLGLKKLSNVFGLLLFFQGIANLLGPPITGCLYDSTQSYEPGFLVAGTVITGSGLILFALPSLQARIKRKPDINCSDC